MCAYMEGSLDLKGFFTLAPGCGLQLGLLARNDSSELSELAFHTHHRPLRPFVAVHRIEGQNHAHVTALGKELHLVSDVGMAPHRE